MSELHKAAVNDDARILLHCLNKGIDINLKDKKGHTALHVAAEYDHVNIVQVLLEKGANVNMADKKGQTALHMASFLDHRNVALLLVQYGVNINQANAKGETALDIAFEKGHDGIVSILQNETSLKPQNVTLNQHDSGEQGDVANAQHETDCNCASNDEELTNLTTSIDELDHRFKEISTLKEKVQYELKVNELQAEVDGLLKIIEQLHSQVETSSICKIPHTVENEQSKQFERLNERINDLQRDLNKMKTEKVINSNINVINYNHGKKSGDCTFNLNGH